MQSKIRFSAHSRIWFYDFNSNSKTILSKVREFGYNGVEIPVQAADIDRKKLKASLEEEPALVPIVSVGGNAEEDLSSANQAIEKNGIRLIQRAIDFCSEIGGNLICGPMYTAVGKLRYYTPSERKAVLKRMCGAFQEIAEFAEERRIEIAIEPLCRYDTSILNTVDQGFELVEMASKDNIGLLLDTFHMNIEEKSIYDSIIRASSKKIFHFHASESDRGTPGEGNIVWDSVFKALNHIKYKRWIGVESFSLEDPKGAAKMRVWRKLAASQDDLARNGLRFLKGKLASS